MLAAFTSEKEVDAVVDDLPRPALSEKHEADHLRKLDYVRGMHKRRISQGQIYYMDEAIREIAKEISDEKPPKAITVARWMRTLGQARGDVFVLVTGHAKRTSRVRQTAEHDELIEKAINDCYLSSNQLSASTVYRDFYLPALARHNRDQALSGSTALQPISDRTFYRRVGDIDAYDVAVARLGRTEARRAFRIAKGHLPADYPLEVAEIDHAQLDLWVIDDLLLLPLGRPWITALRDRYSGMILGIFLSFRGPSVASIFGALRHSLNLHAQLTQTFPDLEHGWVGFGPADTYVSDRGKDFLAHAYRYAIRRLDAEYEYCEKRTPWHKSSIERFMLSLHRSLLETAPGKVFPGMSYSKDYNPQKQATVRFSVLVFLILKWAVDFHPFNPVRGKEGLPIDLWTDGVANNPIPLPPQSDALNVILGLKHEGSLDHEGLRYKHLTYADEGLEMYRRVIGDKKKTEYLVSEENLENIRVLNARENHWMEVRSTRPDYTAGLSLYQHQYLVRESKLNLRKGDAVDQLIRTREVIQTKFAEELERKANGGKVKIARYLGIDSASVLNG